jgi:carnitine 3-dehydrogenase
MLASDTKRMHYFTRIHDAATGDVIATAEQMVLHVDSKAGKSVDAPAEVLAKIAPIMEAHAKLAAPEGAGRHVGQKKAQ